MDISRKILGKKLKRIAIGNSKGISQSLLNTYSEVVRNEMCLLLKSRLILCR